MILRYDHWNMVKPSEWPIVHFEPREMASRRDGSLLVDMDFMRWLENVRREFGQMMMVSSGFRTPEHQEEISGRRTGAHVSGQAADILTPTSSMAYALIDIAIDNDVLGLGIDLRPSVGPGSHYLHLDCWENRSDRHVWTYG